METTNAAFNIAKDFWRDTTPQANMPDGVSDVTEGIAHDGVIHIGDANASATAQAEHLGIVSYAGNGTFQNQVIQTTIPIDSVIMPAIFIRGYNHGTADTIDLQLSFFTYSAPSGSIINHVWTSNGSRAPSQVRLGYNAGFLTIELTWPAGEYFQRWVVDAYCDGNNAAYSDAWFQGWTVSNAGPFAAAVTNIVTASRKFSQTGDWNLQDLLQMTGTAKVSLAGEVRWTNRLITMTAGATPQEAGGFHDIFMPADGAAIPVQGGGTRAVTAVTAGQSGQSGGILLNAFETLWYRAVRGSGAGSVPANFLITPYATNSQTAVPGIANQASYPGTSPGEWIRIVSRDDGNKFYWGTKDTIGLGGQFGGGHDLTIANWTAMKNRANLDGYAFATFASPLARRVGFTGTIRWIDAGSSGYVNSTGYVDSNPASRAAGTTIYGVNGAANRTWEALTAADALEKFGGATTGGSPIASTSTVVALNDNETLYYAPNIDATGPNSGTWYVAGYSGAVSIPVHWLPVVSYQVTGANSTAQVLVGGVQRRLRAGEAVWMGAHDGDIDRLHRRMGITHDGLKYCRFTTSTFFAGAGANGVTSGTSGVMVSWDDNQLMYGISDGYVSWGNQYTLINVPAVGTAIPVATTNGATAITRVVQTIGAGTRRYIPLGYWEKLWYIPAAHIGGNTSVAGGWVITSYATGIHSVPPGAVLVAAMHGGTSGSGVTKTRVKFADGTYMQPGLTFAVAGLEAENDHAQGTGDWRNVVIAGQTGPGMSAAMPAIAGVQGPYPAPWAPQYRPIASDTDPRGQVEVRGLIWLNANVTAAFPQLAFLPGVQIYGGSAMRLVNMIASTASDNLQIPIRVNLTNGAFGGQNGVIITAGGSGMNPAKNPYFTLGLNGGAQAAGVPQWLSLDGIIFPHQ